MQPNEKLLDNINVLKKVNKESDDCYISELGLSNFRNHENYKDNFPNSPICVVGKNGTGKTNVLEAISMLQPGRGIRSSRLQEMVHKDHEAFGINITLNKNYDQHILGTSFNKSLDKIRKVKLDGDYVSPLSLTKFLGIISLTPLMDKIFIETPSSRRKFIDKITWIFESKHVSDIRSYEKLIRERNNLFKNNITDNKWFKNLEDQIVDFGIKILFNRSRVLSFLSKEMQLFSSIFPNASISIIGELEENYLLVKELDILSEKYRKILYDNRKTDYYKGGTSFGPHRSDLEVYYKDKGLPASQCSTGEQKSLLISIILSVCKTFKKYISYCPILLLDEVFAHLDTEKKRALSLEIEKLKIQVFMTGVDESDFMTFDKKSYIIKLK